MQFYCDVLYQVWVKFARRRGRVFVLLTNAKLPMQLNARVISVFFLQPQNKITICRGGFFISRERKPRLRRGCPSSDCYGGWKTVYELHEVRIQGEKRTTGLPMGLYIFFNNSSLIFLATEGFSLRKFFDASKPWPSFESSNCSQEPAFSTTPSRTPVFTKSTS